MVAVLAIVAGALNLSDSDARRSNLAAVPPPTSGSTEESRAAQLPAVRTRVSTPATVPTYLRIRAIDVATDVSGLGLNHDNTVEVPVEPDDAGWFNRGPAPGRPGSAVILGHVDSAHGPAVFFRLRHLETGDRVHVGLSDGKTVHFAVRRVATYPNERFPAQRVYAGSPRRPALNLVTCGGAFDPAAGGYQANVVVYTKYLQTTPSSRPRPSTPRSRSAHSSGSPRHSR